MMQAMLMLRPDLHIDGIELSPKLTELAKISNPDSEILCGNIMDVDKINIPKIAKRVSKEIGSSLEANISINLDEKMINNFESIDFSELCITSSAIVKKTLSNEITVITNKAEGEKCSVCWKINKNGCERHPN